MKKILFLLTLIVVVVFLSGCTDNSNQSTNSNNTTTTTYSNVAAGITFKYPANWNLFNVTGQKGIVGIGDPNSVDKNNNTSTFVIIQKTAMPAGQTLKDAYDVTYANSGYEIIATRNLTIDGQNAIENIRKMVVNDVQIVERDVWLERNGTIYVITSVAPETDFNRQQTYFNIIIDSFKVQ